MEAFAVYVAMGLLLAVMIKIVGVALLSATPRQKLHEFSNCAAATESRPDAVPMPPGNAATGIHTKKGGEHRELPPPWVPCRVQQRTTEPVGAFWGKLRTLYAISQLWRLDGATERGDGLEGHPIRRPVGTALWGSRTQPRSATSPYAESSLRKGPAMIRRTAALH